MIDVKSISTHCTRTEFVGTTVLDTIGLVISGIDDTLLKEMNVGMKYTPLDFSVHEPVLPDRSQQSMMP